MSNSQNAMLGLFAETSLHAGAGQSTGAIDLPIQREAHTDWPCVYGSGVKGALRAEASERFGNSGQRQVETLFGPDPQAAESSPSDHAGALLVSDARLLLLPVRSLTTHFKWVSCPAVLQRWQRDARRLGLKLDFPLPDQPAEDAAIVHKEYTSNTDLFLEEYRFKPKPEDLGKLITGLELLLQLDQARESLARQLVVVNDDIFRAMAAFATPVNPHVRINSETKTVARGALWFEETLPPDTLLYSCLICQNSRRPSDKEKGEGPAEDAASLMNQLASKLFATGAYLRLGGNETTGMGWCSLKLNRVGGQ